MNALLLLILIVPILVAVLLGLNLLLAVHRPDTEKVTPYECGFSRTNTGSILNCILPSRYSIPSILSRSYTTILYPLAVTLYEVSAYGFWTAMAFFGVLTLGFVFEIGSGALHFTDQRSSVQRPS